MLCAALTCTSTSPAPAAALTSQSVIRHCNATSAVAWIMSSPYPRLKVDTVVRNTWKVVKKLAEGGFGAIYEAVDERTQKRVALKIESCRQPNPVLKMEAAILLRLRGKTKHVCGIVDSGVEGRNFNWIAMTLVGRSLIELQKERPEHRFNEATTCRLGHDCLQGIEALHKVGFVHRDIKPGNFAVGLNSSRRVVYTLDFGLARCYRMMNSKGEMVVRPPREICGFRGTIRYASTNAHDGLEAGRHDDIWSLFYMLIEFQRGSLPWRNLESESDVGRMKRRISVDELVGDMAAEYKNIHERLKELRYDNKPDYGWFKEQLRAIRERKKVPNDGPFEWEEVDEGGD